MAATEGAALCAKVRGAGAIAITVINEKLNPPIANAFMEMVYTRFFFPRQESPAYFSTVIRGRSGNFRT